LNGSPELNPTTVIKTNPPENPSKKAEKINSEKNCTVPTRRKELIIPQTHPLIHGPSDAPHAKRVVVQGTCTYDEMYDDMDSLNIVRILHLGRPKELLSSTIEMAPDGLISDISDPLTVASTVGRIRTETTLDTGAGANAMAEDYLRSIPEEHVKLFKLKTPHKVQVGDSSIMEATLIAQTDFSVSDKTFPLYWLILPDLPVPTLIGYPSMERLKIYPNTDKMMLMWKDTPMSKLENKRFSPYPNSIPEPTYGGYELPTVVDQNVSLPPRTARIAIMTLEGSVDTPQGYFQPEYTEKGRHILVPGLVEIESNDGKEQIAMLVINPTCMKQKIKKGKMLGKTYLLSAQDAKDTNMIDLPTSVPLTKMTREEPKRKRQTKLEINTLNCKLGSSSLAGTIADDLLRFVQAGPIHDPKRIADTLDEPKVEQAIRMLVTNPSKTLVQEELVPDDLKEVFEEFKLDTCCLTYNQKVYLGKILIKYRDLWDKDRREGVIERTSSATDHPIETDGEPYKSRARRSTPVEEVIIWNHIEKMHQRNVIRPSCSPWAAPILLADKKNGKVRFCVDFRQLNKQTKKDSYPLPMMDEILAILGSANYFSTIDLTDAFWSIPIREKDIEKTAFISKFGLWEFLSMPFGLTNAPATQQRFIESVLQGLLFKCCFAYIDDVVIYSENFEDHMVNIEQILERLRENHLVLQPAKCAFCRPTFEILGFVATKDGLKPNPKKVEAIKDFPYPRSPKEVERFLGMITWLRRFVPRITQLTTGLRLVSKQDPRKFVLSMKAKKEVDALKDILTSDICMAHPDFSRRFYIHVDASKHALGAILTQLDENGHHRVVEYASKVLSSTQRYYSNPIREALGILWALKTFQYYVKGRRPIIYTDCECLYALMKEGSTKIPDHAMLRDWIARVLQFEPTILHKPGKLMAIPDALSRHYVSYDDDKPDKITRAFRDILASALQPEAQELILSKQDDILARIAAMDVPEDPVPDIRTLFLPLYEKVGGGDAGDASDAGDVVDGKPEHSMPKLAAEQRLDKHCSKIIEYLQHGRLPRKTSDLKVLQSCAYSYWIDEHGILRKIDEAAPSERGPPAVLPKALWLETLDAYHKSTSGGHRKFSKLYRAVADSYFFQGMSPYIKGYCNHCMECLTTTKTKKMTAKLKPYYASYPGIVVHLDCTGGPNKTVRGNEHILAIVDSFSGHIKLFALGVPNAKNMAQALMEYIAVNSMPLKIVTDNGPEFANQLFAELMELLGLKQVYISPYNSKSNGKVEATHEVTKSIIRAFIKDHADDWDLLLPLVEFAMNTSVSAVTKYTPFFIHFGRHPVMPLDTVYESVYRPYVTTEEYVANLQTNRKKVIDWILEEREKIAQATADQYNLSHKHTMNNLRLGETVLIESDRQKSESEGHLAKKYRALFHRELYHVVEDYKNGSYLIQDLKHENPARKVNIDRLKKVKIRHELNLHPHLDGISCSEVREQEDETLITTPLVFPPPADEDDYDVEAFKVVGYRLGADGIHYYKVQLKGYRQKEAKWYPLDGLDCPVLIKDFHSNDRSIKRKQPAESSVPANPKKRTKVAPTQSKVAPTLPEDSNTVVPTLSKGGRMQRPNIKYIDYSLG
jgi:hypothetical protein